MVSILNIKTFFKKGTPNKSKVIKKRLGYTLLTFIHVIISIESPIGQDIFLAKTIALSRGFCWDAQGANTDPDINMAL